MGACESPTVPAFLASFAVCVLALAGCAPAQRPGPAHPVAPAAARSSGPVRVEVPRTIVTPVDAASIPQLYDRARARLRAGDAAGAAKAFERVFDLDPDGDLADDSLFEAGEAWERAGDREAALARYEQTARRFPKSDLGRAALVRSIRLLAFLEQWKRAEQASDLLMKRYHDLRPFESIVAYSGKALGLILDDDLDTATYYIEKGRTVVEDHRMDEAGRIPRDLAQLYYALGEVRRIKAERIKFNPVPANFAAVLEQRCQLLLDAQSAYSDAMRAYDAHWSAMAGYRVGELYESLHQDLMAIPAPKAADSTPKEKLFEGAMRLRYSVLLRKALTMMDHTVRMAGRTGEHSEWVLRAREAQVKIHEAMKKEDAAIAALPVHPRPAPGRARAAQEQEEGPAVTQREHSRFGSAVPTTRRVRFVLDTLWDRR